MSTQGIVFDLWNTLIRWEDHGRLEGGELGAISAALGIDHAGFADYWKACEDEIERSPRPPEDYIVEYVSGLGRRLNDVERQAVDAVWNYHDMALASPRVDVLEPLRSLAELGLRLGLLSNAHQREMRTWSSSPLADLFDAACFSFQGGWRKPEPAAYRDVLEALGISASSAVFVGDGRSGELKGARAAGFGKVVFMRGMVQGIDEAFISSYVAEADAVVDDLRELVRHID